MRYESRYEFMHPEQDLQEDQRDFVQYAREQLDVGEDWSPPTKVRVCPQCDGRGTSSLYLGSYTMSEMDEAGPEFFEDYMSGAYDRTCDTCHGKNVVHTIDEDRLSEDLRKEFQEWMQGAADYRAMCEAERRMGC